MSFFENIFQSISGNTRARINDPFIGAFIGSWILFNWEQLAILFLGEQKATARINAFSSYLKEAELFSINPIITAPLLMAIAFTILFPWISLALKSIQQYANQKLHEQAINIELINTIKQEKLNRQKLLANPEKKFLEQNVQLDIDRRKELIDQLRSRTISRKENADAATAKAAEERSRLNQAKLEEDNLQLKLKLEEEKLQQKTTLERDRFNLASATIQSAHAANRFPSAYNFLIDIENSLKEDNIRLSLHSLSEIVASIFGYESFHHLLSDDDFNNATLSEVKYVYYDPSELASNLEKIVASEASDNEDISADILFDHVISLFDKSPFKLIDKDEIEDIARTFAEESRYDLINREELSGPMAESDTIYDEINIDNLESSDLEDGISVNFSGTASGSHYKEADVPGRDIQFTIEIRSSLLLGDRSYGQFEIGNIHGNLENTGHSEYEEQP